MTGGSCFCIFIGMLTCFILTGVCRETIGFTSRSRNNGIKVMACLCLDFLISYICGNFRNFRPAVREVTVCGVISCSVGRHFNFSTVSTILILFGNRSTILCIEGDGVLVDGGIKLCSVGCITCYGSNFRRPNVVEGVGVLCIFGLGRGFTVVCRCFAVSNLFSLEGLTVAVYPFDGVLVDCPVCLDGHVTCRHGCGDFSIPTCEGVTGLGRICRCSDLSAVILRDSINCRTAIGIKGDGVLVDCPLCSDRYVFSRHGCGDFNIPTCEGITGLGGCGRCCDCCAVILRDSINCRTAIGIKGDGVLVDCPLCSDRYVFSRHGCGDFSIPTCEGITGLGRICRCSDLSAVILRDSINCRTAIGIKGDGVLVDRPVCLDGHVICRHGCGNDSIPTCEGVTGLGGCGRCCDCCAVILRDSINCRTAIGVECDGVLVDCPVCLDGHVTCRHGCGDFSIPTCEGVTGLGGCGRCCDCCAVILRDSINCRTAIGIKGDGVLVDRPVCLDGHVICRHGCGNDSIPTCEGVTGLGRICRCSDLSAVILRDSINCRTAIGIKGDGVLVDCPLCSDRYVFSRHGCGDFSIPTVEGVTGLGGISRCCDCCAVILRDSINCRTAIGVECDGVLVDCPVCLDGHVTCRHGCGDFSIPTCEGITGLGRICRCSDLSAVILRDSINCRTAIGIKGDGVLVDRPVCLDGHVICRHGCGNDSIPTCEGVTGLGRICRCSDLSAVILRDSSNCRTAIGIKGNGVLVDIVSNLYCYFFNPHCSADYSLVCSVTFNFGRCNRVCSVVSYISCVSICGFCAVCIYIVDCKTIVID